MNNDISETRWRVVRDQTRKWWGKLTDHDLESIGGKVERLADALQEKYGYTSQHAYSQSNRWMHDHKGRPSNRTGASGISIVCVLRVLIADDQPRARRSLKALLTAIGWSTPGYAEERGGSGRLPFKIVGEAENGQEAIDQVHSLHPHVVVMDLQLRAVTAPEPSLDGTATIRMIKSSWPAVRIVVLTMYATDRVAVLEAGADAFLLKGCPTSELLDAVMPGRPAALSA